MPRRGKFPHGRSVRNPATYDALKRQGMSKEQAARISNSALKKGIRKGVHRRGGRKR